VVLPGVNHTLGGDFGERKRRDFFVKTFLHEETRIGIQKNNLSPGN
jgi:hypothetical protein